MTSSNIIQIHPKIPEAVSEFASKHGWSAPENIGADMSSRVYYRVYKGSTTAVIMISPEGCPGHDLSDYCRISLWLRERNTHAPEVYEVDLKNHMALIEDFGDITFKHVFNNGGYVKNIYEKAHDVLMFLQEEDNILPLPDYFKSHIHQRHRRIIDWYVPAACTRKNEDGLIEEYNKIWDKVEADLPDPQIGFVHADYHLENIMMLPSGFGTFDESSFKAGILDFQGALSGPVAYDVANLLEDARTTVPDEIKKEILKEYDSDFMIWYNVLKTQFHCRVIGQFIKLAAKDGNAKYMQHIPRLQDYLQKDMECEILKPLAQFFDDLGVDFTEANALNTENILDFIRKDAL